MSRMIFALSTLLVSSFGFSLIGASSANAQAFDRSMLRKVSFDETESRYPSPLALIENIKSVAPYRAAGINDACLRVTVESAPVLGAIDPQQLQPLDPTPGPLFFSYLEKCMKRVAKFGFQDSESAQKNSELILGRDLMGRIMSSSRQSQTFWNSTAMSALPREAQQAIVERFIYYIVGPEDVVRYFGYTGPDGVFGPGFESSQALAAFLLQKLEARVPGDNVLGFYSRLAVLLRLGPAIKN